MSAVIKFPLNRIDNGAKGNNKVSAEVVIFPGVRIDRSAFSLADRIAPSPLRTAAPAQAKEIESV
jgi:hypothetical protein